MSTRHYSWAWQQSVPTLAAKLALLCVVEHADKHGRCWPKIATIARETGMSYSTAKRALTELENAGLIEREHRHRADGSRDSDLITLVYLDVPESADWTRPENQGLTVSPWTDQGLTVTEPRAHPDTHPPYQDEPAEPSTEPTTEPTTTDSSLGSDDVEQRNAHASEPDGEGRAAVTATKAQLDARARHRTAEQRPAADPVTAPSAPTPERPTPTARHRRPGSSSAAVPKGTATLPRAPGGRPR